MKQMFGQRYNSFERREMFELDYLESESSRRLYSLTTDASSERSVCESQGQAFLLRHYVVYLVAAGGQAAIDAYAKTADTDVAYIKGSADTHRAYDYFG